MQTTFFRKRVFVLAAVERLNSRFSTKSPDVPLVRIVSAFVLLSSAGVCFCSYHTICKARPVDLPMHSIFPQEGRAGCTRYNGDHTPNALDCRATPSSVSTLAVMAARGYCFLECSSWRRKRAVIDTILRRCIGHRIRDVFRRLTSDTRFRTWDSLQDVICWRTASRRLWSRRSCCLPSSQDSCDMRLSSGLFAMRRSNPPGVSLNKQKNRRSVAIETCLSKATALHVFQDVKTSKCRRQKSVIQNWQPEIARRSGKSWIIGGGDRRWEHRLSLILA
jgi:hypothetical protein